MNLKCVDSTEPGRVAEQLAQIIAAVPVAVADELSLSALAILCVPCPQIRTPASSRFARCAIIDVTIKEGWPLSY